MTPFLKHKKPILPTVILSVLCAALVIIGRTSPLSSVVTVAGMTFAFTDAFVIVSSGIGGLGSGLTTFVILFIFEFLRTSGDIFLYAISIYLIMVLVTASLSYKEWFRSIAKTALAWVLLAALLSFLWYVAFTILPMPIRNNIYSGLSYWRLLLMAAPETLFACGLILFMNRYAPERLRNSFITGLECVDRKYSILPRRVTVLSMLEALVLCGVAIICTNLFAANDERTPFNLIYIASRWERNLQLGLVMMCAAVPAAYLLNLFIMNNIVRPVNDMSLLMDEYFSADEKDRVKALPDLDIHSGDEVERLYISLQKMVSDMSDHIEAIVENEKRTAHLTRDFMLALAKAVDAKDHYTSGHSQRVAEYSREIARRMGKSEEEQEEIYTLGLLHDIGKIGVPEAIINKNGRLTDEEFAEIKKHPGKGYDILKTVEEMPRLATGARWHHERYDGRGYPDGLAGEAIPEEARIIGVADAYDAMTSNRAYSKVREQSAVRAEIERCRGSQFDPEIADVMLQMIDDDRDYRMHE